MSEIEGFKPKAGGVTHPLGRIDSQVIHRSLVIDVREVIGYNSGCILRRSQRLLLEEYLFKLLLFTVFFAKVDSEISDVTVSKGIAWDLNALPELVVRNGDLNPLSHSIEVGAPWGLILKLEVCTRAALASHKLLMQQGIFNWVQGLLAWTGCEDATWSNSCIAKIFRVESTPIWNKDIDVGGDD